MLKVFIKRLLFLLLFLPVLSFAQSGYYIYEGYTDRPKFADPQSACDAYFDRTPLDGSTKAPYLKRPNEGYYRCQVQPGDRQHGTAVFVACPQDTFFNGSECTEEPDQCEAGKETSIFKFIPNRTVVSFPPTGCLAGCTFVHTSSTPCWYPMVKDGVLGSNCKITYTGTGEECSGGDDPDSPPDVPPDSENQPDGPPNPDCKRFVNADGSWGYNCNPKPEPDENNNCPPGYMIQGDTCFRIPPDHPDYDEDKDPEKPGEGDGDKDPDDTGGTGGLEGVAQEKTLQDINKNIKDIDASIKSGTASTNGDGDGDGPELTAPEEGSFEEASVLENEEIAELQDAINAKFAEIKAFQLPGLTLSGGGGNLPVVSLNFGIFGTHQLDFNELQQPLIMMGSIFVFICGLLAVFIMFVRT